MASRRSEDEAGRGSGREAGREDGRGERAGGRPDRPTYGPSVTLAKLYEVKSREGRTYYRGRMGAVRVVLVQTQEKGEDGAPIWALFAQESVDRPLDRRRDDKREDGDPE